jgi:hypothetical protein
LPVICSTGLFLALSLYLVFKNDEDFRYCHHLVNLVYYSFPSAKESSDTIHLPANLSQLEESIDLQKLVNQKYFKKKVPSCGFLDIIIATPNSGKHINKQSLVPTYVRLPLLQ